MSEDKPILSCSNCHRKIHSGVISESQVRDRKAWLQLKQLQPQGYKLLDQSFFENEAQKGESRILHLRAATWSFILKGDYIDRDCQSDLLALAEKQKEFPGDSFIFIRGKPGSGKSALMRWLAYQLYSRGNTILHMTDSHDDWREKLRKFSERRSGNHFYVIADDVFRTSRYLSLISVDNRKIWLRETKNEINWRDADMVRKSS